MSVSPVYTPDPRFEALGLEFADPVDPADFPQSIARHWNDRWAAEIGLEGLSEEARKAHFHRFDPLPDNQAKPLALRYHGHQFRTYNPEIGDGRGFLFGQVRDRSNRLLDFGTKGSGRTPYSRSGDGRLTLKGAVREVLAAELLEARGVYTSKIFAVYETGEALHRGDEPSPTRSAVMTRLSHSHVRIGMFQRHAFFERADLIEQLADYALREFYPHRDADTPGARAANLLDEACRASARLAAQWMAAGFVHGVLNTDNLVVTGESFDYGPWRFLPAFEPGFTAAYFDHSGLYAYARQPEAVFWALQQFAGALSLVADRGALIEALEAYPGYYRDAVREAFLARLGLEGLDAESDGDFVTALLGWMKESGVAWEGLFHDWFCGAASAERALAGPRAAFYRDPAFAEVRAAIEARAPARPERLGHPVFQREEPVHMVIEDVEALWAKIAEDDDWSAYEAALADIAETRRAYDLGRGPEGLKPGFLEG